MRLLLFAIESQRYAVPADAVVEMVRAVAVTPLAGAPDVVEGLIDVRGQIVPVFSLRRRLGLPARSIDIADHFVIARSASRVAALHVDHVLDLANVDDARVTSLAGQVAHTSHVPGVATLDDGMALIHDLDAFLSAAESDSLNEAMASASRSAASAASGS